MYCKSIKEKDHMPNEFGREPILWNYVWGGGNGGSVNYVHSIMLNIKKFHYVTKNPGS